MSTGGVYRRASFYALLSGAASLVPLPVVDEQLLVWVRRRMVRELTATVLRPATVRILSGTEPAWRIDGCLLWAVLLPVRLLVRLLLGLFRKLLLLLSLKKGIDEASRSLHEAVLLVTLAGREAAWLDQHAPAIRSALEAAMAVADPRPVEQVLRRAMHGGRRLIAGAARLLLRSRRRQSLEEEEQLLGALSSTVAQELAGEQTYFTALEGRFRRALDERIALPPG